MDLIINGSFWLGTVFGGALAWVLLNEDLFAADLGWRLAFGLGRCSAWASCWSGATCPRAPAGCSSTATTSRPRSWSTTSNARRSRTGKEVNVFHGYLVASAVTIAAGVAEWLLGVDAERRSLEDIAKPLTAEEAEAESSV